MAQLADPGKHRVWEAAEARWGRSKRTALKVEVEDPVEVELAEARKRFKQMHSFQQWSTDATRVYQQPLHYNPVTEPSPLGLRLRKSPSLQDLIQMRLAQDNSAMPCAVKRVGTEVEKKKDAKDAGTADKLKASNFPVFLLRIGSWECVSRHEGNIVAKCYFAKHKLVWEILSGELKSKIEIQWSDITALKALCPENGPGTLDIVLARQPLFFKETNPQPRKHTLWQPTSDFTDGQASKHRRHFLQCPSVLLSKHFDKIIQCDPRLNSLSRQPNAPYFEPKCSASEDLEDSRCHSIDHVKDDCGTSFPYFNDTASPSGAASTSSRSDLRDSVCWTPDFVSRESASPSSAIYSPVIEETTCHEAGAPKDFSRDLVGETEHRISVQRTSKDPLFPGDTFRGGDVLEEITNHLLNDSQYSAATSDEKSLMPRVNSLLCLLQKEPLPAESQQTDLCGTDGDHVTNYKQDLIPEQNFAGEGKLEFPAVRGDVSFQASPTIPRKESAGDLLHDLRRIASLPFLLNIPEGTENQN